MIEKIVKFVVKHYGVITDILAGAAFAVLIAMCLEFNTLMGLLVATLCLETTGEYNEDP